MTNKLYQNIVSHYENCFLKHGDNHLGVDWPKLEDVEKRYKVMLDILNKKSNNVSLLDFGCGASHLYEYIKSQSINNITYTGLDISPIFIEHCKNKFPDNQYIYADILDPAFKLDDYDYIVANGVYTEKRELTQEAMEEYFFDSLTILFNHINYGLAFNAMSIHVDWMRDDLFHLSFDKLSSFIYKNLTRKFLIRQDYGLYEFCCYIYK